MPVKVINVSTHVSICAPGIYVCINPEVYRVRENKWVSFERALDKVASLGKVEFHFKFRDGECSRTLLTVMSEFL